MKKIIYIMLMTLLASPLAWGQEEMVKQDPKAQEKIKAARIAYITDKLGLTPAEAEKFWPVYNEFARKRVEIRGELELARKNKPDNKTDEEFQKDLIDLNLKLKQRELDLEKEYSDRILNVLTPQKVMALRRAEIDFRNMVIKQIQQRQLQQQRRQEFRDKNEQRMRQRNN